MNKRPFVIAIGVDYAELCDAALARAFEHISATVPDRKPTSPWSSTRS
jgi:hypothetical protein